MPDLKAFRPFRQAPGQRCYWTTQTARLMVGVPDYETYVAHRKADHPGQPIMSYVEFLGSGRKPAMR